MPETLKLKNPILIEGIKTKELLFDTEAITAALFCKAEGMKAKELQKNSDTMMAAPVAETDYSMHLYLGFVAIQAAEEEAGKRVVTVDDLNRVRGTDVNAIMRIGRNFMLKSEEDEEDEEEISDSPQNKSENA